ncbi:MAG: proline dehydrogenase [Actinomycetia bacterium]|jgi:proline dehydrogenase|nr:proline dehydrogenase [Actinomycetes bacterium]MDQ1652638.1 proline dehydrogenase [Cryptosporangiaceae bacterium]MDQ1656012.1 proline dehydrogenase [Cryptosporangiaceae bacterium]
MFRSVILAASRNHQVERAVANAPVSRNVVRRFVAGSSVDDALAVTRDLVASELTVSLDYLGEDTHDADQATATKDAYLTLLKALDGVGLAASAEVSVKLSAVGQLLDRDLAVANARAICQAAADAGTTVTLDMEDHTSTDSTLEILAELRRDYPQTGAVLQAYLRRTEGDCRELSGAGSRVRLCKGAYAEPESVAFQSALEVDKSYVRCMNVLMAGEGYPMLATHDPRLIAIAAERAKWHARPQESFEFQLLYGVRPEEQLRLVRDGYTVRVYVPYGDEWYAYLMRRLAERPANVTFFLRALASKK